VVAHDAHADTERLGDGEVLDPAVVDADLCVP
jgi:hypothetical protein